MRTFVRRILIAVLALGGMAPSGTTVCQAQHSKGPLTLGDIRVYRLQDAEFYLPVSLLSGIDRESAIRLSGGIDSARTPANAFLVRTAHHVVLVDAGMGKYPGENSGHLMDGLKDAGVDPGQVDLVLITHFHFDHIGGLLTPDGKRAFPNAIVRSSKVEGEFWLGDTAQLPANLRVRGAQTKAIFAPYVSAGRFKPCDSNEDLGDGIRAIAAYGHTPGHMVYTFTSKGKQLWCIGDLIHFGAVQFEHPSAGVSFDSDGQKAVAARLDFFRRAADANAYLAAAHIPAIVRLAKKEDGFTATPVR